MLKNNVILKNMSLIFIGFFVVTLLLACGRQEEERITYTVTFNSNGGSEIAPIEVENGRRIPAVSDPTKTEEDEFAGWFKDDGTFSQRWNFENDIITDDVTLHARWRRVEPFPSEVGMTDEDFSNTMSWVQTGITQDTDYQLTFYLGTPATRVEQQLDDAGNPVSVIVDYISYSNTGIVVEGAHTVNDEINIEWTPNEMLQGGMYKVVILTDGENETEVLDVKFKGEGTESNPYLLFESKDIASIANQNQVGFEQYYKLYNDIEHESAYANIQDNVFSGYLDGNGKEIIVNGNAGLLYELSNTAIIENLIIRGTVLTGTTPLIGGIAHENRGIIRNTTSWITITSAAGEVGNLDTKLEGGIGGLVGINHEGARIEDCMFRSSGSSIGVLKGKIGVGGVASINYGTISRCENRGALGAFNAVESGRSLSNYSYMGGIAGFNHGLIEQSNTTSVGKLLAQRYWNVEAPDSTGNNRVIGGVVGYNGADGIIRESYFNGIRVHGDQYIGGIAGINAGLITHSYAGARYYDALSGRSYVGGRVNVGGIAGALEGDGRIEYSYSSINVYAYEDTPYAIASEAFNSVYIQVNHDSRATGSQEYGNVSTDTLQAPTGTGNTAVNNSPLAANDEVFYELPGSFAEVLGSPFINHEDSTILAWELE